MEDDLKEYEGSDWYRGKGHGDEDGERHDTLYEVGNDGADDASCKVY